MVLAWPTIMVSFRCPALTKLSAVSRSTTQQASEHSLLPRGSPNCLGTDSEREPALEVTAHHLVHISSPGKQLAQEAVMPSVAQFVLVCVPPVSW